jgi:hypothetical protein
MKTGRTTIKKNTKVLVHGKSTGCPFSHVASRKGIRYPKELPFYAYIKSIESISSKIYTITYNKNGVGGDYYHRDDFELADLHFFTDKDFEL